VAIFVRAKYGALNPGRPRRFESLQRIDTPTTSSYSLSQISRCCPPPLGGHLREILDLNVAQTLRTTERTPHPLLQENPPREVCRVEIKIQQLIILDSKTTAALCPTQLVIRIAASGMTPRLKLVFVYERHKVAQQCILRHRRLQIVAIFVRAECISFPSHTPLTRALASGCLWL